MAGRCLSVTHEALGTVRVMRTCGMMGEVVGKAAYLCIAKKSTPRGVYQSYLGELIELFKLPGASRRESIDAPIQIPADVPKEKSSAFKSDLPGIVVDDSQAKLTGNWTEGTGLKGYLGSGYQYTQDRKATAKFPFTVAKTGKYEVRVAWQPHENRADNVQCEISPNNTVKLNQKSAPGAEGFTSVGTFPFTAGEANSVTILSAGANGNVHVDAVWIVEAK